MRILFIHPNAPAQFYHLSLFLAQDPANQVVYLTMRKDVDIPGMHKAVYEVSRQAAPQTHHYVRNLENAVLQGQAAYRTAGQLKAQGFIPDIIIGASGWGATMYMKDLFPNTPLVCYYEWFYRAHGSDVEFGPHEKISPDDECRIRTKNAPILIDLYSCDRGYSPTYWQHSQFPVEYVDKIQVIHDGINTEYCVPKADARLALDEIDTDLSQVEELVTYVGRGMEPYRGFPQFMESIALLLARRPKCHVVIVGEDRVAYGAARSDGKTFKQAMLEQLDLDMSRVHFTGHLPKNKYLEVLQASAVHVYLTRPFVLSWSLLEAMSVGCCVVASGTLPVTEVINDGVNGLLADFFSPAQIADRIEEALIDKRLRRMLGVRARATVQDRYNLQTMIGRQLQLIQDVLQQGGK